MTKPTPGGAPHLYEGADPDIDTERCKYSPALQELLDACAQRIYVPEPAVLVLPLAAWIANYIPGLVPCWLMVVAQSSWGKTMVLLPLGSLPGAVLASDLSEAGLLSGSSQKDRMKDSTGGLLARIGKRGVLVLKDFTSVLSFHADKRQAVLAALREIFDGRWDRHLGTDGGRSFTFEGHVGLIAGCTTTIDSHHSVMALLGERFLYMRYRDLDRKMQAHAALNSGGVADIKPLIHGFLQSVPRQRQDPDRDEFQFISDLGLLGTRMRSTLERDPRDRDVVVPPAAEAPGRLVASLLALWNGLHAVGVERRERLRLLLRVVFDCMPEARYRALRELYHATRPLSLDEVVVATKISRQATRRQLEDLEAFELVTIDGKGETGNPYFYALTPETRGAIQSLRQGAGLERVVR